MILHFKNCNVGIFLSQLTAAAEIKQRQVPDHILKSPNIIISVSKSDWINCPFTHSLSPKFGNGRFFIYGSSVELQGLMGQVGRSILFTSHQTEIDFQASEPIKRAAPSLSRRSNIALVDDLKNRENILIYITGTMLSPPLLPSLLVIIFRVKICGIRSWNLAMLFITVYVSR